jgi:alpha-D-xyloside xylohydrolase
MDKKLCRLLVGCALLAATQTALPQEKQADGVFFRLTQQKATDALWMKIQVCTDDIVRVIASREKSSSTRPSLMVVPSSWPTVPWSMQEKDGKLEITTAKLKVEVDPSSGALAWYDAAGTLLLKERTGGGKILTAADVMGEKTWHIQQLFDSPPDEAFYGLGTHQNAVMNWKGHDVTLSQENMVDVVPFLVSNKNYGILWDNYSRTRFGDIREYQPISSLKLFNARAEQGGLTVEYFRDRNFGSPFATATEATIAHDFVDSAGTYPEGFDLNNGSIRWSGEIASGMAGVHKFRLYASSYIKLWLNGQLVVDAWRQNWLPWTRMLTLAMEPGKRYPIKIEWIPAGGSIGLKYLTPEDPIYQSSLSLYSDVADQIDYYFIHGQSQDEVIHGYRTVSGKVPMMPKWAMGYWQSREHYNTQDEIISTVKEFRRKQFPLDNIVQDWFYWKEDQWGSHQFDPARYPDPEGMVQQLHRDLHAHIMISVWPKFYVGTRHYEEFKEKGWLYMHNVEKGVRDWVGRGYVSTFFDPFSAGARDLFWKQVNENLFVKGFDAWWLDSTEPDLQSNVSDTEALLRMHPNALGTAARYRNAYSLAITKGVYENQRKTSPNQRVFILTRSAYAGQQRYAAASWSGDVATRWYDLRAQIPAGMNFSLSGIPYWTSDIGGFATEPRYEHPAEADLEEWRELNTRWFQFGAFCPLFRSHGQFPYREPFNLAPDDHPAYKSMLSYTRLRYRLMPYIYSLAGMVTQNDYTMMRALVMDFGRDRNVLAVGDQYMFGPSLLVNPVTAYKARSRPVYLPAGTGWYDMKTGAFYHGGQSINADAPYGIIPVFVKEGSIIPCGPDIQYTDQKPADPIRLFVYTGADATFSLYEDEGSNYNYEQGRFSTIPFTYNQNDRVLTIGTRQGDFPDMLTKRTFEIVWIGKERPSGLDFEAGPDATVTYDGKGLSVKMQTPE